MADIIVQGKTYTNVPAVNFQKVGGGTATYTEGGGGGTTIEQLNVSAAGTYTAPTGTAYSPVVVPSGSVVADDVYLGGSDLYMSASVNSSGLVTYNAQYQGYTNATVSSGYVSDYTSGLLQVDASKTYQLPTQSAKTITPSTQQQTAVTAGKYTTGAITVAPIPSQYIIPTGTVNITSNGTVDVSQYASANVNVSSGITPAQLNDVNFIDYDGTILYSYTASEFSALTALPPNPSHDGLTAQGWNWTLADAKAQVLVAGILDIGQMYTTSDGKTRIYISIPDIGRMTPTLQWSQTASNGVTVDWGDGSTTETVSGTGNKSLQHTYASLGDYVITLEVASGTAKIGGTGSTGNVLRGNPYATMIKHIRLGSNITGFGYLYNAYGLETITIPNTVTSGYFYSCYSLIALVVPNTVSTYFGSRACTSMRFISIPKECVNFKANAIYNCYSLQRISLPSLTSLSSSMFNACWGLMRIVIPTSVTSIAAHAFSSCSNLGELHFKPATPPTVASSDAFASVPTDCKIYVPTGSLSAYTSAANYPSSSTYTYVEE